MTDDLENEIERAAADLWRRENPNKSVFDCSAEEKQRYRNRITGGPQIVCCVCGSAPVVRLTPPLCSACETKP